MWASSERDCLGGLLGFEFPLFEEEFMLHFLNGLLDRSVKAVKP
jgi:hypothetical protein